MFATCKAKKQVYYLPYMEANPSKHCAPYHKHFKKQLSILLPACANIQYKIQYLPDVMI